MSESVEAVTVDPVDTSIKVFVGNLTYKTTAEQLRDEFSSVGPLVTCEIMHRPVKRANRSLGFGFVSFATQEEADAAVTKFHGKEFDGRTMNVEIARPRAPRERKPKKKVKRSEEENQTEGDEKVESNGDAPKKTRKRRPKKSPVERSESDTLVFVANLPYSLDDEGLAALFKDYKVASSNLAKRGNGWSMGYGFVDLESHEEQTRAIAGVNGTLCQERELVVKVALDKLAVKTEEGEAKADGAADTPAAE